MDFKQSPYLVKIFDFDVLHVELNTPLFIFALVLIVMFFMNKLLFKPVLRTLINRETYLNDLANRTNSHKESFHALSGEYEKNLDNVRAEVAQARAEGQRETQAAVNAILEEARNQARQDLEKALAELQAETEAARTELSAAANKLAGDVVERVVPS